MDRPSPPPSNRRALVFGGSGQIGMPLVGELLAGGWSVAAVSRHPRTALPGLDWLAGDLATLPAPPGRFDAIFSCGPLDHFARWYARAATGTARVVAFGSTSVTVKAGSADAGERDVAARLGEAEAAVLRVAGGRGAAATVLRPTLVYGAGRDRTLAAIAALARRTGHFALPRSATGRRQPVHVQDLARAALAVLDAPVTGRRRYELGGGEVLAYREMVARVLDGLAPPARLHLLPDALFALLLAGAHAGGRLRGLNRAALARMRQDLVFDLAPARTDFGYAPRAFVAADAVPRAGTTGGG